MKSVKWIKWRNYFDDLFTFHSQWNAYDYIYHFLTLLIISPHGILLTTTSGRTLIFLKSKLNLMKVSLFAISYLCPFVWRYTLGLLAVLIKFAPLVIGTPVGMFGFVLKCVIFQLLKSPSIVYGFGTHLFSQNTTR